MGILALVVSLLSKAAENPAIRAAVQDTFRVAARSMVAHGVRAARRGLSKSKHYRV